MLDIVSQNSKALSELCSEHRVRTLAVFGSVVTGEFQAARSDVDIAVDFLPMSARDHARAYFALLHGLEQLFGRKVDLVELAAVRNPYIRYQIESTAEPLYAA